jgi:hypothetical protein
MYKVCFVEHDSRDCAVIGQRWMEAVACQPTGVGFIRFCQMRSASHCLSSVCNQSGGIFLS